jgi:tripeptidyl-peptidase-1
VPQHIQEHLDYVTPGIRLLAPKYPNKNKKAKRGSSHRFDPKRIDIDLAKFAPDLPGGNSTLTGCDKLVTPQCVKALYGIPETDPTVTPNPANSLGIFEEGDFYAQADLDQFYNLFEPTIPAGKYPNINSYPSKPLGNSQIHTLITQQARRQFFKPLMGLLPQTRTSPQLEESLT